MKTVLERLIRVSREELEAAHIIHARPLTETLAVLGLEGERVKAVQLPERRLHEQEPLRQLAAPLGLEIRVRFYEAGGIPIYYVEEPRVTPFTRKLYVYLKSRLGELGVTRYGEVVKAARDIFDDLGVNPTLALAEPEVKSALYYVARDLLGYGPLDPFMTDPLVEEVSWFSHDGPVEVVDKKVTDVYPNVEFMPTNVYIEPSLPDHVKVFVMVQAIRPIVSRAKTGLTVARPIAEGRIPDPSGRGFHRLAAHLDIVSRSPAVTIRKFPHVKYSLSRLVSWGSLSPVEAAYLMLHLLTRGFILIVGGMGSGKSVAGGEMLLVRMGGRVRVATLEELWRELSQRHTVEKAGGVEFIRLDGSVEVLAVDGWRAGWRPAAFLIRHRHRGEVVEVRLASGRRLVVTPDHSLLVVRGGVIHAARPGLVARGEAVPVARIIPLDGGGGDPGEAYEAGLSADPGSPVPGGFWGWGREARAAYIAGVVDGLGVRDGSRVYIRVSSRRAAYTLLYALATLGVPASVSEDGGYAVVVDAGESPCTLAPVARRSRLLSWLSASECSDPPAVGLDIIRDMRVREYDGYVYDIEVPGVENFEVNGVFVHNTTLLQALISALPSTYKVITIEDTPELSTPAFNWHPLYTRRAPAGSEMEDVTFSKLLRHSLRHRAYIVTLGEVRGEEFNMLVQAAASGHGAICTFHSEDPFKVLMRITSPPINVSPASLLLISAIVHVSRAKTWAGGRPRTVRRVMRIFEILSVRGHNVNYVTVFRWNPATDVHSPGLSPEGLARLWLSSRYLRTIGEAIYGSDEAARILADLYVLARFIGEITRRGLYDIKAVHVAFTKLYVRLDEHTARIWPWLRPRVENAIRRLQRATATVVGWQAARAHY